MVIVWACWKTLHLLRSMDQPVLYLDKRWGLCCLCIHLPCFTGIERKKRRIFQIPPPHSHLPLPMPPPVTQFPPLDQHYTTVHSRCKFDKANRVKKKIKGGSASRRKGIFRMSQHNPSFTFSCISSQHSSHSSANPPPLSLTPTNK